MQSQLPASQRASYQPGDLLSFRLESPGEGLGIVPGSIRLSGTMSVTDAAGARIAQTDAVMWNPLIGAHACINQLSVASEKLGTLESISDYGRAVATLRAADTGALETTSAAHKALELCMPDGYATQRVAYGQSADVFATPFCISPMMCINQASSNIPFQRTGAMTVTMILSQASQFLHGADAAGKLYALSNVQLVYYVAASPNNKRIEMMKTECLLRTLPSASSAFQTRGSMVATRMLMSFIPQAQLGDQAFDQYRSVNAGVQRLSFTYGDSSNVVTTTFRNQQEVMANYLFAMRTSAGFASALATVIGLDSLPSSSAHGGYGVGIMFDGGIDMTSTQLGLVLEGLDMSQGALAGYLVFQGAVAL